MGGKKCEDRSRALLRLTGELADGAGRTDILNRVVSQVGRVLNAQIALLLPPAETGGHFTLFPKSDWPQSDSELALASRAFRNNEPVGRGTQISPQADGFYVPLTAGGAP